MLFQTGSWFAEEFVQPISGLDRALKRFNSYPRDSEKRRSMSNVIL